LIIPHQETRSCGYEMIGSPEMFLAAPGERWCRCPITIRSRGATDGAGGLHDRRTGDLRARGRARGRRTGCASGPGLGD